MKDELELKSLSAAAVPAALKKAELYRALNDPEQAQSICHDILQASPGNQEALVLLVLTLTDQFGTEQGPGVQQTREYIEQLEDDYQRTYYTGVMCERKTRSLMRRGVTMLYEGFREAMDWYEKAADLRPKGIDDPILRWNSCLRTIQRKHLEPAPPEQELPLE
jgi:hypothetical protein